MSTMSLSCSLTLSESTSKAASSTTTRPPPCMQPMQVHKVAGTIEDLDRALPDLEVKPGWSALMVGCERACHAAVKIVAKRASENPVFLNTKHKDSTVEVKDGRVVMGTFGQRVTWIRASTDGKKKIFSVTDTIGGTVVLDDHSEFKNPESNDPLDFSKRRLWVGAILIARLNSRHWLASQLQSMEMVTGERNVLIW